MFFCKLLGFIQIFYFKTLGFPQLDSLLDIKNRFGPGFAHMHMDRLVIIAVECKTKPILFKNQRHLANIGPISRICNQ